MSTSPRVEFRVPKHRAVIRAVAKLTVERGRSRHVLAFVHDKLVRKVTLLEFLATMPEGIDFENLRDKNDFGRDIEL